MRGDGFYLKKCPQRETAGQHQGNLSIEQGMPVANGNRMWMSRAK